MCVCVTSQEDGRSFQPGESCLLLYCHVLSIFRFFVGVLETLFGVKVQLLYVLSGCRVCCPSFL